MTWAWHNPHPIPHDHPPHPAADLACRFEIVFVALLRQIARFARVLPLFIPLAAVRLSRAHARIAAILAHLAAGTWRAPRRHTPTPRDPAATPRRRPHAPYLPRRRGWLRHVTDSEVRSHASQLAHLLNDPGTRHILATAPPHARAAIARALRGPARLLGMNLPDTLQFAGPPRPPHKRKPKPPRPPAPEPHHGKYTPHPRIRRYSPGRIPGPDKRPLPRGT